MIPQSWNRWLLIGALPVIVLIFYMAASEHFAYTPDDTFIYMQYARNMVRGNGISFNAGEPSYGFTSPLWMSVIAAGGSLGVDYYTAAKTVDLVFASLSLILFYLVAFEVIRDIAVALVATVAFSSHAWLLRWAGSGMETSLAVFLVLAVVLLCLRNDYFLSVVALVFLTLVRPEAALLLPLLLLDLLYNSRDRRAARVRAAQFTVIYIILLLPWHLYAATALGRFLPTTAGAKAGMGLTLANLASTGKDILLTIGATDAIGLTALLVCSWLLVRRWSRGSDDPNRWLFHSRQSFVALSWIVGLPLFYLLADVNVVSRYLLLMLPFVTIYAVAFLFEVLAGSRYAYGAVFVLIALILGQNQFLYKGYVAPGIGAFEHGMETCLIPMGEWLDRNAPPGAKIVTPDIGAIGYYARRPVCDPSGLITSAMIPLIHQGMTPAEIIEQKAYRAVCDADFVVHLSREPEALKDPQLTPVMSRPFPGMSLTETGTKYYTLYRVTSRSTP